MNLGIFRTVFTQKTLTANDNVCKALGNSEENFTFLEIFRKL
jgi:hypothetical protein